MIHLDYLARAESVQTAPTVCMHCADPACASVWPADAIKVAPSGVVLSAMPERCIGCGNCTLACPFGVPTLHETLDLMMKCDLCYDRTAAGRKPMCATVCPSGALFYGTREEVEDLRRAQPLDRFTFGAETVRTRNHLMVPPRPTCWPSAQRDKRAVAGGAAPGGVPGGRRSVSDRSRGGAPARSPPLPAAGAAAVAVVGGEWPRAGPPGPFRRSSCRTPRVSRRGARSTRPGRTGDRSIDAATVAAFDRCARTSAARSCGHGAGASSPCHRAVFDGRTGRVVAGPPRRGLTPSRWRSHDARRVPQGGHWPTLLAAFLYFDVSFCVWYLLGPLANFVADDLRLSATQTGLLVATPLLGGSVLRLVMGALTDHLGPRRAGLLGIVLTFVPLLVGWLMADSLAALLLVALLLGVPGASFAVALPLASRWYPPRYQGLVMGIAGAGNSGTVLASLFLPRLATAWGWHAAIGVMTVPMVAVSVVFLLCARDSPDQPPPKPWREYVAVLRQIDTLWFCVFYAITFGGFVGLASFLGIFFRGSTGSTGGRRRPDRPLRVLGASCVLSAVRSPTGSVAAACSRSSTAWSRRCSSAWRRCRPSGSRRRSSRRDGAPRCGQRLRLPAGSAALQRQLGVVTGLVGAAGGLGGFSCRRCPLLRDHTGTYASGLALLALACIWGPHAAVAVRDMAAHVGHGAAGVPSQLTEGSRG
jgi:NNP family nitrate/nitrite transporter-like MFS transporter